MAAKYVDEDGIERLRMAIISHAGHDYLYWKEKEYDLNKKFDDGYKFELKEYEEKLEHVYNELKKIVIFFKSKWFLTLAEGETNCERIIARLDEHHVYLMKEKERKKLEMLEKERRREEKRKAKQGA